MTGTIDNIVTALAVLATVFSWQPPPEDPPRFSWLGIALFALFIIVSVIVIGASLWTAVRLLKDFGNTNKFIAALKLQIGTNGGSTLMDRFKHQDDKMEEARLLAEKRYKEQAEWAEQARLARLQITLDVTKLGKLMDAMQAENKWQQQYNNLHAELIAKGINLQISNAAAQAQSNVLAQTAPSTIGDTNRVDVSGTADQVSAGSKNAQEKI